MRPALMAIVLAAVVTGSLPAPAAEGTTGSVVGRVTALHKGMPATADPSWKVRLTPPAGGGEAIDLPLTDGVYETPELPTGSYQVQLVDAFGQPVGAPQTLALTPGAIRADLRIEVGDGSTANGDKKSSWKMWAIVGGAAAALALAVSGGGGGSDIPASPVN